MTSVPYRVFIFKSNSHIPIFTASQHSLQVQLTSSCMLRFFWTPSHVGCRSPPPTSSPDNRKLPGDSSKEKTELKYALHIHQLHKSPKPKFCNVICYQRKGTCLGTEVTGVFVEVYTASLTEKTNTLNPLTISIPESSTFGWYVLLDTLVTRRQLSILQLSAASL